MSGWLAGLLAALLPAARGRHQHRPQAPVDDDDTIPVPRIRDDDLDHPSAPTLTLNDDDGGWDDVSAAMMTRINLPPGRVPPYVQPGDEDQGDEQRGGR